MLPYDSVASIKSSLTELKADPVAIERVDKALKDTLALLHSDDYPVMATIMETSFGDNSAATTLAFHHGLAHQVMDTTMKGIVADIENFATNLAKAAQGRNDSDDDSKQALQTRHDALMALADGRYGRAQSAYNKARNNQHNPFDPDGSPTRSNT